MMGKNKKVLVGLLAISVFILLVFYIPTIFEQGIPTVCFENGNCQHEAYLESVITYLPAMIVVGFIFGIVVSFLYFEKKLEVPALSADRNKVLLSLLQPSERKILGKVIENGGQTLQSEISRVEGIGKVKAHRVIERLIRRGVLEKEQMGKTNILRLKKEIRDTLILDRQ